MKHLNFTKRLQFETPIGMVDVHVQRAQVRNYQKDGREHICGDLIASTPLNAERPDSQRRTVPCYFSGVIDRSTGSLSTITIELIDVPNKDDVYVVGSEFWKGLSFEAVRNGRKTFR